MAAMPAAIDAITASFGVAAMPDDGSEPSLLLRTGDRALYLAKAGGRNRVERIATDLDADFSGANGRRGTGQPQRPRGTGRGDDGDFVERVLAIQFREQNALEGGVGQRLQERLLAALLEKAQHPARQAEAGAESHHGGAQRVAADRDALVTLIVGGMTPAGQPAFDLAGLSLMFARLTENHTRRMQSMGLSA